MKYPSVHVILVNWNGLADTRACIESLTLQDYTNFHIHVVDNASDNHEADVIRAGYPDVNLIRETENRGFCGGNNAGIRAALEMGADYVLILNNDTILTESLISKLVLTTQGLQDVGAVSPLILRHPEQNLIWFAGARWDSRTGGFRHILSGQDRSKLTEEKPFLSEYACGCCLLISRSVLNEVGLMDERYFAYYDEADWCSRMQDKGLRCYVDPSAEVYHKVSGSTPSLISGYLLTRNRFLWMRDHLSVTERARSYPYLVRELLWNCFNSFGIMPNWHNVSQRCSKVSLLAWRDAIAGRFGKWPKRLERIIAEPGKSL